MSKRRRVICVLIGVLMILFSILMGWTSSFLTGRVGNPYSADVAHQLVDEMQGQGAVFADEDAMRTLLHTAIYSEVQTRGAGMTFGYFVTGLNGFLLLAFGLWPSRKKTPASVLDTGE